MPSRFSARSGRWTLALLALPAAIACSNKVDNSINRLPIPDTTTDQTSLPSDATSLAGDATNLAGEITQASANCDCLAVGQWFRFDSLQLTTLDGIKHPVIGTLNNLWKNDIKSYYLNFYFQITILSADSVTFRVVNGARISDTPQTPTDGIYATCLLDSADSIDTQATIVLPRQGCKLGESAPSGINVYAGTPIYTKNCAPTLPVQHAIPVRNAVLTGEMHSDCSSIDSGLVVQGNFSKAALGKICTCITIGSQPADVCEQVIPTYKGAATGDPLCDGCNDHYKSLQSLLEAFGDLQYGCIGDDGGPAVCLTATYSAQRIEQVPPSCPKK